MCKSYLKAIKLAKVFINSFVIKIISYKSAKPETLTNLANRVKSPNFNPSK